MARGQDALFRKYLEIDRGERLSLKPGDVRTVVVRQVAVAQDGVSHLWERHQIHLQQLRLQLGVLFLVLLEGLMGQLPLGFLEYLEDLYRP